MYIYIYIHIYVCIHTHICNIKMHIKPIESHIYVHIELHVCITKATILVIPMHTYMYIYSATSNIIELLGRIQIMCVCVHIYIYTYIHTYIHTYIYIYIHTLYIHYIYTHIYLTHIPVMSMWWPHVHQSTRLRINKVNDLREPRSLAMPWDRFHLGGSIAMGVTPQNGWLFQGKSHEN